MHASALKKSPDTRWTEVGNTVGVCLLAWLEVTLEQASLG